MYIKACVFKRKKDSKWESGISFEANGKGEYSINNKILDKNGIIMGSVWDCKDRLYDLCIDVTSLLKFIHKPFNK